MVGKSNSSVRSTAPGIELVDFFVDLDQRQRTGADVEQVVVDVDVLAGHRVIDDRLQLLFEPALRSTAMAVHFGPERDRTPPSPAANSPFFVAPGERRALQLAAGRLRNALHGNDARRLRPRVLVDRCIARVASGRKSAMSFRCSTNSTSSSVAAPGARAAGGDDLAQFESRLGLQHGFEVVRIIVLAVDEDDLLRAAGDVELALVLQRKIAGAQPAIRGERRRIRFRVLEVAARDVVAADQEVANGVRRDVGAGIVDQLHVRERDRAAFAHQLQRRWIARVRRAAP